MLPHETGTGMDAGTARPVNLWYSRGNPGGANGCPDFPRPNGAPDYGGTPEQLCPYATASGATIMDGPVYRYDPETADPSVAWPEYWSGRWFMFDWNNNSVKHALLMDPETDQDGSQPIYADSLRGVLNWQANYMDSKFAPDGSLYIQVYQGFFDTGPRPGSIASPTRAAARRRAPTRSGRPPATRSRSSSQTAPPAASPGSGTSTTTARSTRPRPIRSTPTRRTVRTRSP